MNTMIRRVLSPLLAMAFLVVLAAPAQAAFISKTEARSYAKKAVRELFYDAGHAATVWGVEPAKTCSRVRPAVVECDFYLYFDLSDVTCEDTIRVIATSSRSYRTSYPYEHDCA